MSLSKKIILLLVLPAVFQLCLLAAVTKLQQKAEEEARAAQKAMHLASLVNSISNEIFFLASVNNGEGSFYRPLISNQDLFNRYDAVGASFAELKTLVKDDPEKLHETLETEEILNKSFKLIKNLRQNWMETGPSGAMERAPLWVELVNLGTSHIFTHFKKFGEEQSLQAEQGPEKQRSLRELTMMVILVLGGLTFFSTGLSGAYLLRGVTRRLDTMRDNALRLASNRPLNPPLPGQDEIAELDSTFHQMAQSLKQARRKEQAIIENANDIICSLGPDLRVLSINPAILTVLGFAPEEVEGMNFKQLVEPANQAQVGEYMQGLIEQKPSQPLEVKMLTASGESVFTLWSVLWSFEEESFFVIVHNIDERQKAQRMKGEITAMVNHDIRSPITTLAVSLSLIKSGKHGTLAPEGVKIIERCSNVCERILQLTRDLLDLDKLEAGRIDLALEPVSLDEIVNHAIETISGLAETRHVRVYNRPNKLTVKADEHRLEQVLTNLISNAVKFSPEGGVVNISARATAGKAQVSVEDKGAGIPAQMRQQIFEPFKQVPKSSQKKEGTGLGLAICKALVEIQGGEIWVESEEGKGTIFLFTVPLA